MSRILGLFAAHATAERALSNGDHKTEAPSELLNH